MQLTHQEIYDQVCAHLAKQGRRSMIPINGKAICAYRGNGGTKCAVGALIPDELYTAKLEGVRIIDDPVKVAVFGTRTPPLKTLQLLNILQSIHDEASLRGRYSTVELIRRRLAYTAKQYFLTVGAEEAITDWTF